MIGHNAPLQVGLLFRFPLFCLCLSVVCSLLRTCPFLLFSLCLSPSFPRTLTNYLSPVSGDGRVSIPSGMSFLWNKIVRRAVFLVLHCSLWYSKHASHMWVEFLSSLFAYFLHPSHVPSVVCGFPVYIARSLKIWNNLSAISSHNSKTLYTERMVVRN